VLLFAVAAAVMELVFSQAAWAWGPAVHTAISCRILEQAHLLMPFAAQVIMSHPLEFLYGSFAADFFVGKGQKKKAGHSHNWETAFRFLAEAGDEREASYAYGFLSHLAADIPAHNYFVPNLIHQASTWKRMGHLYWEARADYHIGPVYMRIAKEVLTMEDLGCDRMLISAVGKRLNGLKTRRKLYTQTVRFSDFLNTTTSPLFIERSARYQISESYLASMLSLSYRLAVDILRNPGGSPCLGFDPIGSRNLSVAGRNCLRNRLLLRANGKERGPLFPVDSKLLSI
jgi:hypothetical protein